MNIDQLPSAFFVIGQYDKQSAQVSPLYFDLPGGDIAIPVWSSKPRAYSWLEETYLRAEFEIVEVFSKEFVPNLIGSKCSCLLYDPLANEKSFAPERVVAIPRPPEIQ